MSPYYYVMIAGIIVFAVLFVLHRKGKLHYAPPVHPKHQAPHTGGFF